MLYEPSVGNQNFIPLERSIEINGYFITKVACTHNPFIQEHLKENNMLSHSHTIWILYS